MPAPMRRVVLVCGPPGSGKTTLARSLGLDVYDMDDERWGNDASLFTTHLRRLGNDLDAQAVVIRSGATRTARASAAALVGATEVTVMTTAEAECVRRVITRKRSRPPMRSQISAVHDWFVKHEPDTSLPNATGSSLPQATISNVTIREW